MPETKKALNTDRALVSDEKWEVETIHQHFPKFSHEEVVKAIEEAKRELKGSESREKIMEKLKTRLK
ncbi:MAG: hypothetical protein JWM04_434 [Verrucomicrobiales bacterium]|nr:hypothetical protein [Verrucomicrobiales bacterium]